MEPTEAISLTEGQRKVLEYIRQRQQEGGIPPTTREIQKALGFSSQTSVVQFLRALQRKGAINTMPHRARGVAPVASSPPRPETVEGALPVFIDVPLYGDIPTGLPGDGSMQEEHYLPVHAATMRLNARSRPFSYRMRGDSMIGAYIQEGDYIVFDAACEARPGDLVAAFLNREVTLQRYVVRDGRMYLKAENPRAGEMTPVQELRTQGVMVGLVRGVKII